MSEVSYPWVMFVKKLFSLGVVFGEQSGITNIHVFSCNRQSTNTQYSRPSGIDAEKSQVRYQISGNETTNTVIVSEDIGLLLRVQTVAATGSLACS